MAISIRASEAPSSGVRTNIVAVVVLVKLAINAGKATPAPRFSLPTGQAGDPWNGFREITDLQIEALAKEIVVEVQARGPFQSLAEFVNRRVEDGELGLKGALQAAIEYRRIEHGNPIRKVAA